jgi:type I restriction enzyme R subunit
MERANAIIAGADFLSGADKANQKDAFVKEALLMCQARSLCRSMISREQGFEAAYFEALRTLLTRITGHGKPMSLKELNAQINDLLKATIQSQGVINLFSDVGKEFSLFDQQFLDEISRMKERNIAVEMLKKLLEEQVSAYKRTNLVKSERFSEMLKRSMNAYINGLITNEQVIEELLKTAIDIAEAHAEGDALGLSNEEQAFYDALAKPEAVKDFYTNEVLVAMTRELTDMLRKSRTIDWQKKESVRASMRLMVKRLLKKYDYPPDGQEDAITTVIQQCEMWADE